MEAAIMGLGLWGYDLKNGESTAKRKTDPASCEG